MKKALLVLCLSCIVFLCACSNSVSFETEGELLSCLDGLWLITDGQNTQSYIAFKDGDIYKTNDSTFCQNAAPLIERSLIKKDSQYCILDFPTLLAALRLEAVLGDPISDVSIKSKQGTVILNTEQQHIIVRPSGVVLWDAEHKAEVQLTRISEEISFSGEHFEKLYLQTIDELMLSAAQFMPSMDSFAAAIKSLNPAVYNWPLVDQENDSTMYTANGKLTDTGGVLITSKDDLVFTCGYSSSDNGAPFQLIYNPNSDLNYDLLIYDRQSTSLYELLNYAKPLLNSFPNALSETELLSYFANQASISSGMRKFDKTIYGINYRIFQTTSDDSTIIYISVPEQIQLSTLLSQNSPQGESSSTQDSATNEVSTNQGKSFTEAVDFSKPLFLSWTDPEGWGDFTLHFAFEESGKFYMLLSSGMEIIDKYTGTFDIAGDVVSFKMEQNGETKEYTFLFDAEMFTFTQTSEEGFAYNHVPEDVFQLSVGGNKEGDISLEKIKVFCTSRNIPEDGPSD